MDNEAHEQEIASLIAVVGLLLRRVRAAASHDLSWSQTTVLSRLAKEGPLTSAELARAEGVKPQSMGTTVAELVDLGMVTRMAHPTDGRQMLLELTSRGHGFLATARDHKRTWLAQAVAQLDEVDRTTLFAATRIFERLVEL